MLVPPLAVQEPDASRRATAAIIRPQPRRCKPLSLVGSGRELCEAQRAGDRWASQSLDPSTGLLLQNMSRACPSSSASTARCAGWPRPGSARAPRSSGRSCPGRSPSSGCSSAGGSRARRGRAGSGPRCRSAAGPAGSPSRWFASTVSRPSSCCSLYARSLFSRPMPRPSCRMYRSTPRPASRICRIAVWSCEPQSHRALSSTSPVKHSLWTRTRTGSVLLRGDAVLLDADAAHGQGQVQVLVDDRRDRRTGRTSRGRSAA